MKRKKSKSPKPDNIVTTGKINMKDGGLVNTISKKYKVPVSDVKFAIKNAGTAEEDIVEWLRTEGGHQI